MISSLTVDVLLYTTDEGCLSLCSLGYGDTIGWCFGTVGLLSYFDGSCFVSSFGFWSMTFGAILT